MEEKFPMMEEGRREERVCSCGVGKECTRFLEGSGGGDRFLPPERCKELSTSIR
jgi:hypothetical protein